MIKPLPKINPNPSAPLSLLLLLWLLLLPPILAKPISIKGEIVAMGWFYRTSNTPTPPFVPSHTPAHHQEAHVIVFSNGEKSFPNAIILEELYNYKEKSFRNNKKIRIHTVKKYTFKVKEVFWNNCGTLEYILHPFSSSFITTQNLKASLKDYSYNSCIKEKKRKWELLITIQKEERKWVGTLTWLLPSF